MDTYDGLQSENTGRVAKKGRAAPVGSTLIGSWRVGVTAHGVGAPRLANMDGAFAVCTNGRARDHLRAVLGKCAESGDPIDELVQARAPDGQHQWVRVVGQARRNESGKITALEGTFRDVSPAGKDKFRNARLWAMRGLDPNRHIYSYFTLDSDWNILQADDRLVRVLKKAKPPKVGGNFWAQFPELRDGVFEAECRRAMFTGEAHSFEFPIRSDDQWYRAHVMPVGDRLAISLHDISGEWDSLKHLRLMQAAVDQAEEAIVITDAPVDGPDGPRIIYANAAFSKMSGYSVEEVIGKTPRINQGELTDPKTAHEIGAALRAGIGVRATILNYRKDGSTYWKSVSISPVRDDNGQVTNWIGIGRDLTESVEAEKTLRQSEERFRLLAGATSDAVFDWDLKDNRIWCNDGIRDLLGVCPLFASDRAHDLSRKSHQSDTPPKFCSFSPDRALMRLARQIHRDDFSKVSKALRHFVTSHSDTLSIEFRMLRVDGRAIKVVGRFFMIRDAADTPRRILASIVDISEKEALQERLRRTQRLEAIGQLTGGISHDFNNMLSIIMGNLEFLIESTQPGDRLHRLAESAMSAAERSADLTSRLLAFSRRQSLTPVDADPNDWLRELGEMGRRVIAENIEIELDLKSDPWRVTIDHTQFQTSILNLIINASRAMPDGGRLTLATENRTISESEARRNDEMKAGQYVVVSVTDTGTGMSPEVMDRIFEPFFTTSSDGTGLGLAMVYGFVKQSGGHVTVESEPGSGTSFRLYFQAHAGALPAPKDGNPSDGEKTGGNSELVLVVEDDRGVRDNVVAMLESLGYLTMAAANGQEALDMLSRNGNVDVLFTDVVMPGGMNGQELATRAKALRPNLKVLFTSGYTHTALDREGRLDTGNAMLLKPYPRRELARKMRTLLATNEA